MNFRFLALLLLVGAAAFAAHGAMSDSHAAAPAPTRGPQPAASLSPVASGAGRVTHAIGNTGAKIVAPGVAGMVRRTDEMLEGLKPAVLRAPAQRRLRADKAAARIGKLHKEAGEHLEQGRPIAAFKAAMEARSLIDAVRQQVIEESIR